jgi:hypothetical protein
MEIFFKSLNFSKIVITENASSKELSATNKNIGKILAKSHKDKTGKNKTALFVYYSGHGVLDLTTKVVCNEENYADRFYPLES